MTCLFRQGDTVSLSGKITYDQHDDDNSVFINLDGYHSTVMVNASLASLVSPKIDTGDRVRWRNGKFGSAIACDAGSVWVRLDDGSSVIWPVNEVDVTPKAKPDLDEEMRRLGLETPLTEQIDSKVGSEEAA